MVLSQKMFLKVMRGFVSVSRKLELSTLLGFFNLVQYENQWRISQFYFWTEPNCVPRAMAGKLSWRCQELTPDPFIEAG